jgi:hypothetical protein
MSPPHAASRSPAEAGVVPAVRSMRWWCQPRWNRRRDASLAFGFVDRIHQPCMSVESLRIPEFGARPKDQRAAGFVSPSPTG